MTLEVHPGDPRYRLASVEVTCPDLGRTLDLALEPSPRLQLRVTLAADQPSALLIVRSLPSERPIHQRLGIGSTVDADDATLLHSTGIVEARGDVREVLIEVGLDVDLPAPLRLELTPVGGERQTLELTLLDPLTRAEADLRPR